MLEEIQHPESCIRQSLPNDTMNVYFGQATFSPNPVPDPKFSTLIVGITYIPTN